MQLRGIFVIVRPYLVAPIAPPSLIALSRRKLLQEMGKAFIMTSEDKESPKKFQKNAVFSPLVTTHIDNAIFLKISCKKLEGNIFLAFFPYQIAVCHVNGDFISP